MKRWTLLVGVLLGLLPMVVWAVDGDFVPDMGVNKGPINIYTTIAMCDGKTGAQLGASPPCAPVDLQELGMPDALIGVLETQTTCPGNFRIVLETANAASGGTGYTFGMDFDQAAATPVTRVVVNLRDAPLNRFIRVNSVANEGGCTVVDLLLHFVEIKEGT